MQGGPFSNNKLDLTSGEGENEGASGSSKSTDMGRTNSRENEGASGSLKSSNIGRTTSRKKMRANGSSKSTESGRTMSSSTATSRPRRKVKRPEWFKDFVP